MSTLDSTTYKVMYHVWIDGKTWDYFTEDYKEAEHEFLYADCEDWQNVHLHEEIYTSKEQYEDGEPDDETCLRHSGDE
jgi:hypothetical protein